MSSEYVVCGYCKCVVATQYLVEHLAWHDEHDRAGYVDPDLEAERVTRSHESHAELLKRVRKERIEPSWKGKK